MADSGAILDPLSQDSLYRLLEARHHDPFEVLGCHREQGQARIRAFLPQAEQAWVEEAGLKLERIPGTDLFTGITGAERVPEHYHLAWTQKAGGEHRQLDPYSFAPQIGDLDLHLHAEGRHWQAHQMLGANPWEVDAIPGVRFAVWAPSAQRVSLVGDFNGWDGRVHPMRCRGATGVWELFIPHLSLGSLYKFELRTQDGQVLVKADPYARAFKVRPDTACLVTGPSDHAWGDQSWLEQRAGTNWQRAPLSIYEVHLGSWRRHPDGTFLSYREVAPQLTSHCQELGFTHVEFLPLTEHPLDDSWGYQATGYFAPTSRFGNPDDFRYLVDQLHQAGIGVILDWVPAHFPRDSFALARFDGTALYEHEDPRQGEHRDWGTLIFNFGRNEVRNFLLASALYWMEEFHIDGLRVDAVASMLYLDYSREPGDWIPNRYGGRENLEAVEFLRDLNRVTHERHPGCLMIAEESTAWPQVSRPTYVGGLGFSMKWNMGWMHDTLSYLAKDPIHRHFHHDLLTFGLLYLFSENFVLPFSHDEVVHGKRSMLDKMPGDAWQKFANLRLLYTYMFAYPGKKLLFMGCEFGQGREWNFAEALDWDLLERDPHRGMQLLVRDLNHLYQSIPALHDQEFESAGFAWIDCHDSSQSVLSFARHDRDGRPLLAVLNFTPVPRNHYRIGVPQPGRYRELLNSDAECYGGGNWGNIGPLDSEAVPWMNREHSLMLTIPPLGGLLLSRDGD